MSGQKAETGRGWGPACAAEAKGPVWPQPSHCVKSGHRISKGRAVGRVAVEGGEATAGHAAFILSALGATERLSVSIMMRFYF